MYVSCFWFAWKPNLFHELDPRRLYTLTFQKPEAWVGLPVLIARCLYLEAWRVVRLQNRAMKMLLSVLWLDGQCYACWGWCLDRQVGRTEYSLANVFESLRHMAPHKPGAILLASCTRVWVRLHAFWKPVSVLHTTWFLRWLLLSKLPASWQCFKKPALEGGRECLGLGRWPPWLPISDGFVFGLYYLVMWVLKLPSFTPQMGLHFLGAYITLNSLSPWMCMRHLCVSCND